MHPVWFDVNLFLPFLKEYDIAGYFRSRIILKCSIWKSYGTDKLCPLCQILSDGRITLIQCSLRGNKCHNSSRSYLVKCLCQEIVMNTEVVLVILRVIYLIISKGYISNCHIKEVIRILCLLKSTHFYMGFLIKLSCNSSRNIIQLHTVQICSLHWCGKTSEEVTDTHTRL